ncbi:MAG TPA: heavy metal-responsive transcriptional regulator, partial [Cellvibrio sp.]
MQLTIGKLAGKTGLSADTIRYYEKMGLITPLERSRAGYRLYSPDTARVIRFIKGAKSLNFTLDEIRKLLVLDSSDRATCAEILKTTENKINEAETKIADLREIVEVLQKLIKKCPGDGTSTSECPILDHLHKSFAVVFMLASFLLFTPNQAFAKPISYVGGTMMMQENDETGNTLS